MRAHIGYLALMLVIMLLTFSYFKHHVHAQPDPYANNPCYQEVDCTP